jgi:hypothetical protein
MLKQVTDPQQQEQIVAAFIAKEERWKSFRRESQPPAWLTLAWGLTFILCSVVLPYWAVYHRPEDVGRIMLWLVIPSTVVGYYFCYSWLNCRQRMLLRILEEEAPALYQKVKNEKIA